MATDKSRTGTGRKRMKWGIWSYTAVQITILMSQSAPPPSPTWKLLFWVPEKTEKCDQNSLECNFNWNVTWFWWLCSTQNTRWGGIGQPHYQLSIINPSSQSTVLYQDNRDLLCNWNIQPFLLTYTRIPAFTWRESHQRYGESKASRKLHFLLCQTRNPLTVTRELM